MLANLLKVIWKILLISVFRTHWFKVLLHQWCLCLCQLSGLALLGVGVWMLVDPHIVDVTEVWTDVANSELLRIAAIVLIVVGSLLFIISLMGIIGAVIEHKVILGIVRTLFYVDARFRFPERCKFQRCADRCPGFGSESESESPF